MPPTPYGTGLAGTGGVIPTISTDCPQIGDTLTVSICQGFPGAQGCLAIGITQAALPVLGGMLLVGNPAAISHQLDNAGHADLPLMIPGLSSLIGQDLYLQSIYADTGAAQGVSFTEGVMVVLGA